MTKANRLGPIAETLDLSSLAKSLVDGPQNGQEYGQAVPDLFRNTSAELSGATDTASVPNDDWQSLNDRLERATKLLEESSCPSWADYERIRYAGHNLVRHERIRKLINQRAE